MSQAATVTPQEIVLKSTLAYIISAALGVALKLELPDLMAQGLSDVSAGFHARQGSSGHPVGNPI